MKDNITTIQKELNTIIQKLNLSSLMQCAAILLFLRPVRGLFYSIFGYSNTLNYIFGWNGAIFYVLSFVGLLLCFAKNDMTIIGVYFGLLGLSEVIDLFSALFSDFDNSFTFYLNTFIYILFYGVLAFYAFNYNRNKRTVPSYTGTPYTGAPYTGASFNPNINNPSGVVCCPKCGSRPNPNEVFCRVCGTKIQN